MLKHYLKKLGFAFIILGFCNLAWADTFEGDGVVTTDIAGDTDFAYSLTLDSSGKILVAGSTNNSSNSDIVIVRYESDGSLDTSFGDDGIVTTDIAGDNEFASSLALDSSGKIVVAGYTDNGFYAIAVIVRYESDGTLDTSFGGDGIVTMDISEVLSSLVLDSSGKILVAGDAFNGSDYDIVVARYESDGSLDTSFGDDGIVTTDIAGDTDFAYSLTLDSSGKILVTGETFNDSGSDMVIVRYKSDGSLDESFGGDGIVTTHIGSSDYASFLALDSSGKILVAGETSYTSKIVIVRYESDGDLDPSFGEGGIVTTDIVSYDFVSSLALDVSSGKILVAGRTYSGSDSNIVVARYKSDGTLDTSFGDDGIVTTDIVGDSEYISSLVLDSSGKILVAGSTNNSSNSDIVIVRYESDGDLSTSIASGAENGGSGGGGCQLTTISGSVFHLSSFIFLLPLLAIMAMRMKKNNAF